MFGIGTTELIVICILALILFGNRLPSVMRSLGQGITEFKRGLREDETPPQEESRPSQQTSSPQEIASPKE